MATTTVLTPQELRHVPLLPVAGDAGARALASASSFGPFAPGSTVVVASSARFHTIAAATGSTQASTSSPTIGAGCYKFVMPDGCYFVSMVDSSDGAGFGQAYQG